MLVSLQLVLIDFKFFKFQQSFESVKLWLKEIDYYADQNVKRLLIGNKSDLIQRVLDFDTAKVNILLLKR